MFSRCLPIVLALAALTKTTALQQERLLSEDHVGMQVARSLRELQFEDLPDICTGFELIIDEIPNGRDSCDCDGTQVACLFRAVCDEEHKDEPHCMDAVEYVVAFENDLITVLSCALIVEGNFEETCAKVSLAGDLQLGECLTGTYGGKPCDCTVCEGRGSLLLDCSAYDPRAKTSCTAMGIGQMSPLSSGFNTTAPPPNQDSNDAQDVDEKDATPAEPESSGRG